MRQYQQLQEADVNNASDLIAGPSHSRITPAWHAVAKEAVSELASTSAAFLVDETPINSAHKIPSYFPPPLTPTRKRKSVLLDERPQNEEEWHAYQETLATALSERNQYKHAIVGSQATLVLQGMYVDRVTKELANNEEKRKKKKGQLNGDSLPKLLTGDEFYNRVVEHNKSMAEQEAARETR